jgi:hypothetical protein
MKATLVYRFGKEAAMGLKMVTRSLLDDYFGLWNCIAVTQHG